MAVSPTGAKIRWARNWQSYRGFQPPRKLAAWYEYWVLSACVCVFSVRAAAVVVFSSGQWRVSVVAHAWWTTDRQSTSRVTLDPARRTMTSHWATTKRFSQQRRVITCRQRRRWLPWQQLRNHVSLEVAQQQQQQQYLKQRGRWLRLLLPQLAHLQLPLLLRPHKPQRLHAGQ